MNDIASLISGAYMESSSLSYSISSEQGTNSISNTSTLISYSSYNQLSLIKNHFYFNSCGISEVLIRNNNLSDFIKNIVDQLGTEEISWTGELKIIEDEYSEEKKMLLVYRPFYFTNSSSVLAENSRFAYNKRNIYNKLINSLFHAKGDLKNYVVIDEQVL